MKSCLSLKEFYGPSCTLMGALVFKGHYTSYLLRTFGLGYELALNTIRPPLKGLMPRNYTFGVCGLPPWSERRLETF